jgi:transglutaminase-like putative cysteine protease
MPARPSLTLFSLLAGAFLLTLVPHVIQFPLWVTVGVVAGMALRSVIEVYRLPLPSTTFCGILAMILFGCIWWQFGRISGRDAGTALTAGLLAIKFYELRGRRDVALIVFSSFFMVMSALLYSQVLELFIYCLIMMWVLTALLLRVHTGDLFQDHLLRMLGQSGIIFLQALPLALFLFIFFPRYTGKLSIMLDDPSIGLTDTVSPGSIAKLSDNDSEAMDVLFTSGKTPSSEKMYWRALVLWDYKNGAWTPGDLATRASPKPTAAYDPNQIGQEITIRRHNQKWLFALDVPVSKPINTAESQFWAVLLDGDTVQLANDAKLDHIARYTVLSSTIPRTDEVLSRDERHGGKALPDGQIDKGVQALADELHQGLSDAQEMEYVYKVLYYFRHEGFTYNTAPGIQGPDWLPVFLFKTKTGFCEHFASAFAILMRCEQIPARLVVGYQGGDFNPYTDKYVVTQSNAHAWDEVWIDTNKRPTGNMGHWMRVDPTAIVPVTEEGLFANNPTSATDPLAIQIARHQPTFAETYLPDWVRNSLKEVSLRREQVETDWDNLVFSYDPEAQNRLAQALGFSREGRFQLLLVCLVVGGVCLVVFQRWMARKLPVSPVESLYAAFCRKMAQRGIPRASWEGPLAYTERVAEAFPDDKPAIQRVGSLVACARYGPAPADSATPHELKSLLTLITASQAAATSRERQNGNGGLPE